MVNPDAPEWSNPKDSEAFLNGEITSFLTHMPWEFVSMREMQSMDIPDPGCERYPYHSWAKHIHGT